MVRRKSLPFHLIRLVIHLFLIVLVIAVLYPLFWLIVNSLKTNDELFSNSIKFPAVWKFHNYVEAWNLGLSHYFVNSLIVGVVTIVFTVILGSACAYGISRFHFRFKRLVVYTVLGGLLLSPQVALLALYKMFQTMHIYNTLWAVIIPCVAFQLPFAIFLMRAYFLNFPKELEESAYMDGCSTFRLFTHIVLPISKPILSSVAIITAIFVWNEFLFALVFIEDKSKYTVPVGLSNFRDALNTNWTVMLAGIVVASIPLIVLFIILQRHFINGLTQGSVKG